MAFAAARPMNQHQRRALAAGKPTVAKLHKGYEAWVEIKAHFGEPVLLALSFPRSCLAENLETRQLSQAVGQRGAWNVEGRAECFERPGSEEGLANDQKCPGVGNDIERTRDGAVALAPCRIRALCSLRMIPQCRWSRSLCWLSPDAPSGLHPARGTARCATAQCRRHSVTPCGMKYQYQRSHSTPAGLTYKKLSV